MSARLTSLLDEDFDVLPAPRLQWRPAFPNRFLIFVTLGLCDFVQTCFILSLGGEESNEIAAWLMQHYGLGGAALYKLGLIGMVLCLIEWLWRRDRGAAGRLANYAVILGALPVVYGLFLLLLHFGIYLI